MTISDKNKVFAEEKITKLNLLNQTSKTAKIRQMDIKGQFSIEIAELKNTILNFWLENEEFRIVNHRSLGFFSQPKVFKLSGM